MLGADDLCSIVWEDLLPEPLDSVLGRERAEEAAVLELLNAAGE